MKKILTFVLAFFAISAFAQQNSSYIMTGPINLQECDVDGAKGSLPLRYVPSGAKFTIVKTTDDNYIIRFWQWVPDDSSLKKYKEVVDPYRDEIATRDEAIANGDTVEKITVPAFKIPKDLSKEATYYIELNVDITGPSKLVRYFIIDKGDLEPNASPLVSTWSPIYGAVVMPFKARPQNGFDFTKDLSISGMGGLRYSDPLGKKSISFLLGVGIASVTLDASNTKNTITTAEDRAAITVPIGVVLQLKKLQLGVFTGFDFLSQNSKSNWAYQNKPWLSLGIGFTIFSEQDAPKKEGTN